MVVCTALDWEHTEGALPANVHFNEAEDTKQEVAHLVITATSAYHDLTNWS